MNTKDTNPKDAIGSRKAGLRFVPRGPLYEVGLAMLEGALKYGGHNWRVAGVRASVYIDAADGHLDAFWEGEDLDPDSRLSHITKAIASLLVLRDSMMQGNWTDDRPVVNPGGASRRSLSDAAVRLIDACPNPKPPNTQSDGTPPNGDEMPPVIDVTCCGLQGQEFLCGKCGTPMPSAGGICLPCAREHAEAEMKTWPQWKQDVAKQIFGGHFGMLNGVPSDYPS